MLPTLPRRVKSSRAESPVKAARPMELRSPWTVTLCRPVQAEKAQSPMLVTPAGITASVRQEQAVKALSPMLVTLPSKKTSGSGVNRGYPTRVPSQTV